MQPIKGTPQKPPGAAPSPVESQLSPQQRTILERLITRIVALNTQQNAEVWAGLKHDLGIKNDAPLLPENFADAEQNLNQRLTQAQTTLATRQMVQQLTELLPQGNNRQAVSDFIRLEFGQTALSQLSETQLKSVLTLLQQNQLNIPIPQQRPVTDRALLPAEHHSLNQLVIKLAATSGEPGKHIWETMLELVGVKYGEPIPARFFAPLSGWLQARQAITLQSSISLNSLQAGLKQPLTTAEWQTLSDYCQRRFHAGPHTPLTALQAQEVVNHIFLTRANRPVEVVDVQGIQPVLGPIIAERVNHVVHRHKRLISVLGVLFVLILIIWLLG